MTAPLLAEVHRLGRTLGEARNSIPWGRQPDFESLGREIAFGARPEQIADLLDGLAAGLAQGRETPRVAERMTRRRTRAMLRDLLWGVEEGR